MLARKDLTDEVCVEDSNLFFLLFRSSSSSSSSSSSWVGFGRGMIGGLNCTTRLGCVFSIWGLGSGLGLGLGREELSVEGCLGGGRD